MDVIKSASSLCVSSSGKNKLSKDGVSSDVSLVFSSSVLSFSVGFFVFMPLFISDEAFSVIIFFSSYSTVLADPTLVCHQHF